jgi:hypothetical protein
MFILHSLPVFPTPVFQTFMQNLKNYIVKYIYFQSSFGLSDSGLSDFLTP